MAKSRKANLAFGTGLLVVGAVLLATRLGTVETAPAWLLGIGVGLALIAILSRSYAPLVGGMVLLGLGAGMLLGDRGVAGLRAGTWMVLGLGAGFIAIYLLGVILQLKQHWWPLIPGVVLLAVGGARFVRHFALLPPQFVIAARAWWPAVLVVAGVWVVVRALRR
jgi:hypothetical protein